MARSEARLQFGMWRAGLDGATAFEKLVYAVLLTEPTLNHCGVGAIRMSRWAKDASLTVADTERTLKGLVAGSWVLLDEDTDEVFVRTLIRNDGVAAQPYVLKGALREALKVESKPIRRALAAELRKLPAKQPDGTSRSGARVTYPDPHATAAVIDPGPPPEPTRKPVETLFDADPPERVSSVPVAKGSESPLGGGGGGGGGSCSVGGHLKNKNGIRDLEIADTPTKIAQALAADYRERVPLCSFVAVMKIAKRAVESGYDRHAVQAALHRLADAKRSVTADALRIELDGQPLRAVSGGYVPYRNPDPSEYDELPDWEKP